MKKILLLLAMIFAFSNIAFAVDKVHVYYFYSKPRCAKCVKIQQYTKSAIDSMKDNNVFYQAIDTEKNGNKNLAKKYNLYTKSVIISKTKNGKEQWKNLDQIWVKIDNEQDFKNYIITEIKKFKGKK